MLMQLNLLWFRKFVLTRFAILLGDAPDDFRQKKIEDMFDFLDSKWSKGGSIVTFANGIPEMMLELVLDNSIKQLSDAVVEPAETTSKNERHCERSEAISRNEREDCFVADAPRNDGAHNSNGILLYICTKFPVKESDKSIWLGGEEIRCDVIRHYQGLAEELGIDMQVVMEDDSEILNEKELGWEKTIDGEVFEQ